MFCCSKQKQEMSFSSPSNGSDDLYGTFDGQTLVVRSNFDPQYGWELRNFTSVKMLNDPAFRCGAVAVVVEQKIGKKIYYIIIQGSQIYRISDVTITDWRTVVGNSNCIEIIGKLNGQECFLYPSTYHNGKGYCEIINIKLIVTEKTVDADFIRHH